MTIEERVEALEKESSEMKETACQETVKVTSVHRLVMGINRSLQVSNSQATLVNLEIQ